MTGRNACCSHGVILGIIAVCDNSIMGRNRRCYGSQHIGYGNSCIESGVGVVNPVLAPFKRECTPRVSDITVLNHNAISSLGSVVMEHVCITLNISF